MFRVVLFLMIVGVVGGGYWLYSHGTLPKSLTTKIPFLASQGDSLASLSIPKMPKNAGEQLDTVKDRATEVGNTVGNVLGTAVQQASSSGSLQEKAFDYGSYLYCQQVVKDYEARNPQ